MQSHSNSHAACAPGEVCVSERHLGHIGQARLLRQEMAYASAFILALVLLMRKAWEVGMEAKRPPTGGANDKI